MNLKRHCRWVEVMHEEEVFGVEMSYPLSEIDAAAIIPVAVEFKTNEKEGVNLLSRSEKTAWYAGPTLVEAIRRQVLSHATDHVHA